MRFNIVIFGIAIGLLCPLASFAAPAEPRITPGTTPYPRLADEFASAIVYDSATGKELFSYEPDRSWNAASLTKLMSALVFADRKPKWDKVVSIKKADEVGGGRLRVTPGSTMTIRDLLYSSLIGSANNAANALARLSGVGMKKFVAQMNAKAKALGMRHAKFTDASGMDTGNIMTAREVATLAKAVFTHPVLKKPVGTSAYSFRVRNRNMVKLIHNTNALLTQDPDVFVTGGKTGYLEEADYNLVVALAGLPRTPEKPTLLVVVLGSPTRSRSFASAKALANWAWEAYSW